MSNKATMIDRLAIAIVLLSISAFVFAQDTTKIANDCNGCVFEGWYLNIDGNTGKPNLADNASPSGTQWIMVSRATSDNSQGIRLQNDCNGCAFEGWYLNIDGNTGELTLANSASPSGTQWIMVPRATSDNSEGIRLQNDCNGCTFEGWYLNIDGNTGELTLADNASPSGTQWVKSTGTVNLVQGAASQGAASQGAASQGSASQGAASQGAMATIPSCEDLGAIPSPSTDLLDGGYPRQQFINQDEIVVYTSEPCTGAYVFPGVFLNGELGLLVEDALFTFESTWKKVDVSKREPRTGVESEFEFSRSNEISTSIAAEMAIGFSVEATGGFKPLGVGGELTLGSSVEFSIALERGIANATEVSHSFPVRPGEEVQLWGRQINVTVEWAGDEYNLGKNFKDPFVMGQDFVRELYQPSLKHSFIVNNKMTEEAAEITVNGLVFPLIGNWPTQDEVELSFVTNGLNFYNEWVEDDFPEGGYTVSYKIPAKEIYPSRYFY